jgi:hypothetical protein
MRSKAAKHRRTPKPRDVLTIHNSRSLRIGGCLLLDAQRSTEEEQTPKSESFREQAPNVEG